MIHPNFVNLTQDAC